MQRTSSVPRVLGRTAVGAVVAAAALVPAGGATAWAESPAAVWTVDTSAPAGLGPIGGGGWGVTIPLNVCSVEWTVTGGSGGAGSAGLPGEAGGELRVTTRGTAGQTISLYPGTAGQAWADGGVGGTNGSDGGGAPGASDGGGGGGGSEVRFGTAVRLIAHGGDGGGATGGVGGATRATPTGNAIDPGSGGPVTAEATFDGAADDAGASGRSGSGVVRGVGVPCPATAPGAPRMIIADSTQEDGVIRLVLEPATPRAHEVWAPVTGWEVSLDGTATWRPLPVTAAPADLYAPGVSVEGLLQGFVRDLPNGYYPVAVRAVSAAGPSTSGGVRPVRLVGTPTAVTVTDVGVTAGVSSLRVSWAPPSGTVYGYVAESYDAAQDGENVPFSLCEAAVDEHSCVLAAEPGRSYRVVVSTGGRGAAPVTSGVVAAPPVPAQVPTSSGTLDGPGAGAVTAGQTVDVAGAGYLAGSTVTVVVYSTPTVLGSLVADDGTFDTSVTLPAGLPAGEHTLVATGVGPDGETWTLTRSITAQGTAAGAGSGPAAPSTDAATGAPSTGGLAYTGAYVGVMAVGGVLTLVVGVVLVLLGRRRRTPGRG